VITISFTEYTTFGYLLISKNDFKRYIAKAILTAVRFTFERLTEYNITEHNKRGICEIAELYYKTENQIDLPLSGFSNNGYSEQYVNPASATTQTVKEKAYGIMQIYFTSAQLFRGA